MAHYSHQFLAEQLLQFRTTPVYARYNFSASRTKYTSTKEKYRPPRIYTEQPQYFSYKIHFNQRKTQSNDRLYLNTVVTIRYPVYTKETRVQKKLTAIEMTASFIKYTVYTSYSNISDAELSE